MAGRATERIVADLRGRIDAGELTPGDLLPSARQITREWHVAIATATRVHAALRDAGLAETLPGIGVVVRRPTTTHRARTPARAELIVAKAVAIADAEGLEAVSIRRLAVELDTAPMSLYRHVVDKEELLLRMLDAVMGEWRAPARGDAGWRECLEAAAHGLWELFRRHPWLAPVLSLTRPAIVGGGIGWTEWVLDALVRPVPDPDTRLDIYLALFNFIRGTAVDLETESVTTAATGLDADQWMDTQLPTLRAIAASTGHDHFKAMLDQPFEFSLNRVFSRGLGYLLDGVSAQIDP